jgi:oligopeptide/dipeptide ABC transporter ATP-binding protein
MYGGRVVEKGTVDEIFERPQHPYTWGLLGSMPRLASDVDQPLTPIPGTPPSLLAPPTGCPFAPRGAWRVERCWTVNPPLTPIDGSPARSARLSGADATHRVACHNQPTREEAEAGRPLRPGFVAAPPPGAIAAQLPEPDADAVAAFAGDDR